MTDWNLYLHIAENGESEAIACRAQFPAVSMRVMQLVDAVRSLHRLLIEKDRHIDSLLAQNDQLHKRIRQLHGVIEEA